MYTSLFWSISQFAAIDRFLLCSFSIHPATLGRPLALHSWRTYAGYLQPLQPRRIAYQVLLQGLVLSELGPGWIRRAHAVG